MKILFTGGGSLGPVTPLLAVLETWKKNEPNAEFFWIGTTYGPEKKLLEELGIRFFSLPTARFPRYLSVEWIEFPLHFFQALYRSWKIIKKEQPNFIASAGGFTSVPVVILGRVFGISSWVHQQDVVPLLTTKILVPFVSLITVTWPFLVGIFPKEKTIFLGNPVRVFFKTGNKERAYKRFDLYKDRKTVLVIGGGGGSQWINEKIKELMSWIKEKINVIHVTGPGKKEQTNPSFKGYFVTEILKEELPDAFAVADIVLSRAGMGLITECVANAKVSIFIPLPNSPQEKNGKMLEKDKAAILLFQEKTNAEKIKETIEDLLQHPQKQKDFSERIHKLFPTDICDDLVKLLQNLVQETKRKNL